MYSIVYVRNGLEMIPTKWLTEGNKSYYPPYSSFSKIERAIKLMENPEPFWKTYIIKRVFGTAVTYEQGIKQLEAAIKESETETDCESIERKQKWRHEHTDGESIAKKQRQIDDESNLDDDEYSSLTNPPELKLSSRGTQTLNICETPGSCSSLHSSREERSSDDDFKNFLKISVKEIFRKLNRLEEKLEVLTEIVSDSNKNSASETESLSNDENIFPLASIQNLEDLEEKLEDDTFFKKTVNSLKLIGGKDSYSAVIGVLKKVLSNEVAEQYSLAGAKKKRCFKDLILYRVLLEAVRYHRQDITEVEFAALIARWLVQARLRRERAEERKIQMNTTV